MSNNQNFQQRRMNMEDSDGDSLHRKVSIRDEVLRQIKRLKYNKNDNLYDITEWVICLRDFEAKEPISLLKK